MHQQNVCKFNFNRSSDLVCANFIRETQKGQSPLRQASGYYISLVLRGEGIYSVRGIDREIREGMLLFVCDGDSFSVSSEDGIE